MTKSSEVLRLAAEYALTGGMFSPILLYAEQKFNYSDNGARIFADIAGYNDSRGKEETCMVLCLAAAIAESEGD